MFPLNGAASNSAPKGHWWSCVSRFLLFSRRIYKIGFWCEIFWFFQVDLNDIKTLQRPNKLCFQSSSGLGPPSPNLWEKQTKTKSWEAGQTLVTLWARPRTKGTQVLPMNDCCNSSASACRLLCVHWQQVAMEPSGSSPSLQTGLCSPAIDQESWGSSRLPVKAQFLMNLNWMSTSVCREVRCRGTTPPR